MTDDEDEWKTVSVTKRDLFEIFHGILSVVVAGLFGVGILWLAIIAGARVRPVYWLLVPVSMRFVFIGFVKWRRNRQAQVLQCMYDTPADDEE